MHINSTELASLATPVKYFLDGFDNQTRSRHQSCEKVAKIQYLHKIVSELHKIKHTACNFISSKEFEKENFTGLILTEWIFNWKLIWLTELFQRNAYWKDKSSFVRCVFPRFSLSSFYLFCYLKQGLKECRYADVLYQILFG